MLKIVSDPAAGGPQREVPLTNLDGRVAVVARVIPEPRHRIYPRFDGGRLAIRRKRRSTVVFEVTDWDNYDAYRALLALEETGQPVYILPNFDASTLLDAPLQGRGPTTKPVHWEWDPTTRALKTTPQEATFTRAGTAYVEDAAGNFQTVAANVARYAEGMLGYGIIQEAAWTNDAPVTHPDALNLLFINLQGGAQAAVWDTTIRSPVPSKGGAARLDYIQSASSTSWTYSYVDGDTVANKSRTAGVWLTGDATVRLRIILNSIDSAVSNNVTLSPHHWTRVDVCTLKASIGDSIELQIELADVPDSDGTLYAGPVYHRISPTGDYRPAPSVWTDTSHAAEVVQFPLPLVSGALSIAWTGRRFPPKSPIYRRSRAWSLDTPGLCRAEWTQAGRLQVYLNTGHILEVVPTDPTGSSIPTVGEPYYASLVIDPGANTAAGDQRARLLYRTPSETIVATKTGSQFLAGKKAATTLTVGNTSAATDDNLGPAALAHLRVDQRAWTEAEQDQHARLYTDDGHRALLTTTLGRRFLLTDIDINPRDGRWQDLVGQITAVELDHNPDLIVAPT